MTLQEIYNLLFSGKRLQLEFSTRAEMDSFRIKLHQTKLANEKPAVDVGIMAEEERQQLNFQVDSMVDGHISEGDRLMVTLFLSDKIPKKQYTVKILED